MSTRTGPAFACFQPARLDQSTAGAAASRVERLAILDFPGPADSLEATRSCTKPTAGPRQSCNGMLAISPSHRLSTFALSGAQVATSSTPRAAQPTEGAWLLRAACLEAQAWRTARPEHSPLRVTVALPPRSARAGTLVAQTEAALHGSGLPASLLEVALAECDLGDEGPELLLLVSALRDLGAGVAMDGLSHIPGVLRTLRRLPLTSIRLHPDLTRDIEASADTRMLVAEAIRRAHASDARVVAGNVRTALQGDILADLHCDEAQGPVFAGSVSAAAFRAALGAPP